MIKLIKSCSNLTKETEKFLNVSQSILVSLDSHAHILKLNKRAYEVLGYKEGTLEGKNWLDIIIPFSQRAQVKQVFAKMMSGKIKNVEYYENKILTKSGKEVYIKWHNVLEKNKFGKIIGTLSSGIDITSLKNTEIQLRDLKEQYESLYNSSKDAIMILEPPTWKFSLGNPATIKIFNVKNHKVFTSLGPWDLSPKYQPDGQLSSVKAKKMIDKAMKEGSNFFEWTHLRYKDGEFYATILLSKINIKGKDMLQATVRDITEQKLAQDKIKESEEKYRSIFDNAVDAIFIADPITKRLLACNKSAEILLGYSHNELCAMTADKLHPEDVLKRTMATFELQAKGKYSQSLITEVITKHGKRIPVSIKTSGYYLQGKYFLQGIFRDISIEKEAEDMLKQAYQKLKEVDLMKTEFLSMTSHELKTPLTPMRAQLQRMLSQDLDKSDRMRSVEVVLRNALRLEKLINEVLDVSRLESNRLVLDLSDYSLNQIIESVSKYMGPLLKERNIALKIHPIPNHHNYSVDRSRIEQVFINLIDNAVKHSECGHIDILARINDHEAVISVKDDGKGISLGDQKQMFTKFFRGVKPHIGHGGMGLGLSISKGIIEAHGGKMWVDSKLGKGAVFSFTLPFKKRNSKTIGFDNHKI
ncbi:MAG: PAS domain S-box protein [Candidatus Woesearchaeota archaeon]